MTSFYKCDKCGKFKIASYNPICPPTLKEVERCKCDEEFIKKSSLEEEKK